MIFLGKSDERNLKFEGKRLFDTLAKTVKDEQQTITSNHHAVTYEFIHYNDGNCAIDPLKIVYYTLENSEVTVHSIAEYFIKTILPYLLKIKKEVILTFNYRTDSVILDISDFNKTGIYTINDNNSNHKPDFFRRYVCFTAAYGIRGNLCTSIKQ